MQLIKTKHRQLALRLKSTNKTGARKIIAFHLASDRPIPAYLLKRYLKLEQGDLEYYQSFDFEAY
ncbi:MAG: hypothetical protein AAFZ15_26575 [Bacteroidota bacterium]